MLTKILERSKNTVTCALGPPSPSQLVPPEHITQEEPTCVASAGSTAGRVAQVPGPGMGVPWGVDPVVGCLAGEGPGGR